MSLLRIVNLLQAVLFLLFCAVGSVFVCADVYWYYILDSKAQWETIIHHEWSYECIWYLDCFTFLFMYLWLAVKLLRAACRPKTAAEALFKVFVRLKPFITFDTLFKAVLVFITLAVLSYTLHGGGQGRAFHQLVIISDIRPMANIWYDIVCPLQWLWSLLF